MNFVVAKSRFKPDYFLYENNKSTAQPIKEQISVELGVPLQYINSALVSAQNRERFYAHNFGTVPQPADRGILLKDILDSGVPFRGDKSPCLDASYFKGGNLSGFNRQSGKRLMVAEPICVNSKVDGVQPSLSGRIYDINGKHTAVTTCHHTKIAEPVMFQSPHGYNKGGVKYGKAPTVTASKYQNNNFVIEPVNTTVKGKSQCLRATYFKSGVRNIVGNNIDRQTSVAVPVESIAEHKRAYEVRDGYIEIKGKRFPVKLQDGYYVIRKLTVAECCRLQTLPSDYCRAVSDSRAYCGLGASWTAEVIIHLLSYALAGVPKDERIIVLSMYDGIGTGRYAFDMLGYTNVVYYGYEVDKYAIRVAKSNYSDIICCGDAFAVRERDWFMEKAVAVWESFYKKS